MFEALEVSNDKRSCRYIRLNISGVAARLQTAAVMRPSTNESSIARWTTTLLASSALCATAFGQEPFVTPTDEQMRALLQEPR